MQRGFLLGAIAIAFLLVLAWEASTPRYAFGPPWGAPMVGGYNYAWGPAMMGRGMMGWAWSGLGGERNLSVDEVRSYLETALAYRGNPHIKLGNVAERDAQTIVADIVTTDKEGLVQRFAIDRRTGFFRPEGG